MRKPTPQAPSPMPLEVSGTDVPRSKRRDLENKNR